MNNQIQLCILPKFRKVKEVKKMHLIQEKKFTSFVLILLSAISFPSVSLSQGITLPPSLSGMDLNSLIRSVSGNLGAVALPAISTAPPSAAPNAVSRPELKTEGLLNDEKNAKKNPSLPPNEFQKYLLQVTGQNLTMYGADFFENLSSKTTQINNAPVGGDYLVGPGDQLLIRIWGSTNAESTVTVDREGTIQFPRLGTLPLVGVKAAQIDGVVKGFLSKFYKDIEVSVSFSQLRKLTVYAVGHARNPGSYSLGSEATLTTALLASGGPNNSGSIRKVQIKRQGHTITEFDFYSFLSKGDKSKDIKLQDGDVLFYPKADGFMALVGKVNTPGVYEIKEGQLSNETLGDILNLAGGVPLTADIRRATLESFKVGVEQPRKLVDITLNLEGLRTKVTNGDVLRVISVQPELSNSVYLRGAVAQPSMKTWFEGMRVTDIIDKKSLLINSETVRKQNEVLFSTLEMERTARDRAKIPYDLASERVVLSGQSNELTQGNINTFSSKTDENSTKQLNSSSSASKDLPDKDISSALLGRPQINQETLVERIGHLNDEVNLDYAVIERFSRDELNVKLINFNLNKVLSNPKSSEDVFLQPGDIITILSAKDLRLPKAKKQIFVRIEGEVNSPGIYQVVASDDLQSIIQKAGGLTEDAYIFALGLFREEVKKNQITNMEKLIKRMSVDSESSIAQINQSTAGSADIGALQAKAQSIQNAQKQTMDRLRQLKPEGRISLNLTQSLGLNSSDIPKIKLESGDRIYVPTRPDFINVFGSVNTEAALVYRTGLVVKNYLEIAGLSASADLNGIILVRADGSAKSNQNFWSNDVLNTFVMPGDTIFLPEKLDRESNWSKSVRTAKDFTQLLYQLGLGAAAIKTLRQ
jgi:protein involved in polysaccharide export with SLBB domain